MFFKSLFMLIVILFLGNNSYAQFEQKVTLQASLSYHNPVGEKDFSDRFHNGVSVDGGIQYNYSRTFSVATLLKYTTYQAKVSNLIKDGEYNNFGVSICPKFRFIPSSKINPYVFGGLNINFIGFSFTDIYGTKHSYDNPFIFGYTAGAGLDFKLSENLALFLQGGYNSINYKEGEFSLKMNSIFAEVGINLNIFKSKSL